MEEGWRMPCVLLTLASEGVKGETFLPERQVPGNWAPHCVFLSKENIGTSVWRQLQWIIPVKGEIIFSPKDNHTEHLTNRFSFLLLLLYKHRTGGGAKEEPIRVSRAFWNLSMAPTVTPDTCEADLNLTKIVGSYFTKYYFTCSATCRSNSDKPILYPKTPV